MAFRSPWVLYQLDLTSLTLEGPGFSLDVTKMLRNGRVSYGVIEPLVARCTGLDAGTQGRGADLSEGHEVKAYADPALDSPRARIGKDVIHTAASCTFASNGVVSKDVRDALGRGDYRSALTICKETGYDLNDAYIYTNTAGFDPTRVPFRYVVVPSEDVIRMLCRDDPRRIHRRVLLEKVRRRYTISGSRLP